MTDATDLKPCPFCGGTNVEHNEPPVMRMRNYHVAACEDCCADAPLTEWNERAPSPAVQRVVEEMKRVIALGPFASNARSWQVWCSDWIALLEGEGK